MQHESQPQAVLGDEFALILLIHGDEDAVAVMQRQLPELEEQLQLTLIAKTTAPRHAEQHWLPYRVRVVAMDHPDIIHRITDFFSAQKINIEELGTETYAAPHTGTPMFSLAMTVAPFRPVRQWHACVSVSSIFAMA